MVTQTITLSMIPGGVTPRIYASQNDHGLRVFVFNLVDENGGYAIPSGTTALLNVLKPDRTVVSETCTWSGSTVTADCTEQMTAVAGNVHCEVRLVAANGDAVGSANFILGVESNPLASGVVSESDFDSISDMVDRAVAAASIPPTYVTDWLEENITQETGYVIDQSLTMENAAADAKAAGDLIRASFVVGETSGSIASFTDGADGVPLKDLVVNIQPKQAGTGDPSPSNIRAISGWTGANITRTGKNMFALAVSGSQTVTGVTITINDDGTISLSGTNTGSQRIAFPIGTYTVTDGNQILNGCPSGGGSSTYELMVTGGATLHDYGNGTSLSNAAGSTITVFLIIRTGVNATGLVFKPMIRNAADSAEYEPYNGNTYNVSFGSAGTVYGGTLDVLSGILTVTHIGRSYDGTEDWTWYASGNSVMLANTLNGRIGLGSNTIIYGVCSHVTTQSNGSLPSSIISAAGTNNVQLQCKQIGTNFGVTPVSLAGWQAYLATTPLQLTYKLAQPISVQLDPVSVASLIGNNNIFADCGTVDCEYRADTKLYIEHLTDPDSDMIADANITSGSYFMVGNNLYLATANIANGGAITPGTNCTATNLAAALNAINS